MSTKTTSRKSYREHVLDGKARTQRERIIDLIDEHPQPLNRRELSEILGIPINAICGRVKALLDGDQLDVAHVAVDPVTSKRVEYLEIATREMKQGELFLPWQVKI